MAKVYEKINGIHVFNLNLTESVEASEVEMYKKLGYEIIQIPGAEGEKIYRRSLEKDGYVRDMKDVEWSKEVVLFDKEEDHSLWKANVILWFDGATNDEGVRDTLKLFYPDVSPVKILEDACKYMMNQRPNKKGGRGKRRGDICNWLLNDRIPFAEKIYKRVLNKKGNPKH